MEGASFHKKTMLTLQTEETKKKVSWFLNKKQRI